MNRWLAQNQLRSLDEAYRGALQIQELERQYFGGDRIAFRADLSKTVFDYVKTKRDRQLLRVRANLARFRLTSFLQNAEAAVETAAPTAQGQKILFSLFVLPFSLFPHLAGSTCTSTRLGFPAVMTGYVWGLDRAIAPLTNTRARTA